MRIFLGLLFTSFCCITFAQEKVSLSIEWETLNTQLSENHNRYSIVHKEIIPSLSHTRPEISIGHYRLMEINLAVDLRKQRLKDETPILLLPENKFIQSDYAVSIPTKTKNDINITITGNGNGGYNSNTTSGGVKNTAYKDASTYTGIYCPVTGLPLIARGRNNN
ncbi:hypothetical protein ACWGOQ_0018045 [Aquimarina sp. M1]